MDEIYNSILENLTSDIFKNKNYDEQINNFNKLTSQTIDILIDNQSHNLHSSNNTEETEDLWFKTLNKLYDISIKYDNQLKIMSKKRKQLGSIFEEAISDNIKDLLEKMSVYVGVRRILDVVSEENKTAGYKEFKPILLKIFETYDNQSFILNSVIRLFINACLEHMNYFKIENVGGRLLELIKCDVCKINFTYIKSIDDKRILVFKCSHVMHCYCAYKEIANNKEVFVCPICRKNEIDDAVSNLGLPLMGRDKAFVQEKRLEIETKVKLNKYGIDINSFKRGFNIIKNIDMYNAITNNAFFEESARSCRGSYRKIIEYDNEDSK
jgi:hypothetical protein